MDLLTPEVLQPLGVSAVLAVFLWLAWKRLESKDQRIKEMTDNLERKYEENTKATVRNTEAINSFKATQEKFVDRFDELLRNSHNGKE